MTRPPATPRRPTARGLVGFVLVAAHAVVAVGVPAPRPFADAAGRPFPCRGKACGCSPDRSLSAACCCARPKPAARPGCCSTKQPGHCDPKPVGGWALACRAAECHGYGPAGLITHPPTVPDFEPVPVVRAVVPPEPVLDPGCRRASGPARPPTPPPKHV